MKLRRLKLVNALDSPASFVTQRPRSISAKTLRKNLHVKIPMPDLTLAASRRRATVEKAIDGGCSLGWGRPKAKSMDVHHPLPSLMKSTKPIGDRRPVNAKKELVRMDSALLDQVATGNVLPQVDLLDPNETLDGRLCDLDAYALNALAREQRELSVAIGEAGLHFEGKPYPVSLRPYVLGDACADEVITASEWLIRVLDVVAEMYRDEGAVRELFPCCRGVEKYSVALPDFRPLVRICRLDGLFAADGVYKFIETNTDCPGGIIQNGMAARIWARQRNSLVGSLDLHVDAQPFAADPNAFTRELLNAHRSRTGRSAERAAIVNYRGRYTNETDWMVRGLQELGIDAELADASTLSYRNGRLYDGAGKPIDLTYNKYELRDFIGEPEVEGYLEAAAAGDVTFLNTLIAQWVLSDKAIFAVLTDERFALNFSASDREMIRRHVPWTRLVEERDASAQSSSHLSFELHRRESSIAGLEAR